MTEPISDLVRISGKDQLLKLSENPEDLRESRLPSGAKWTKWGFVLGRKQGSIGIYFFWNEGTSIASHKTRGYRRHLFETRAHA